MSASNTLAEWVQLKQDKDGFQEQKAVFEADMLSAVGTHPTTAGMNISAWVLLKR